MGFEFNNEKIPSYKLGLHVVQIVLSLTCWCLEIAVFRWGDVNGRNGWTFGVCFLTVPAWIYLIGAPRWPRSRRLANPHAMVCIDALFVVIWLSAFATQAAYNTANECGSACGASKAIVGLGVFETLFWVATTFLSIATLRYYDSNGVLPGYENLRGNRLQNIDPDKAAFSTAPHDEEAYAPVGMSDHDNDEPEFNAAPYGNVPHDPHDPNAYNTQSSYGGGSDTSYHGAAGSDIYGAPSDFTSHSPAPPSGSHLYAPPPANDDYDSNAPAQFPAADYSRGTH